VVDDWLVSAACHGVEGERDGEAGQHDEYGNDPPGSVVRIPDRRSSGVRSLHHDTGPIAEVYSDKLLLSSPHCPRYDSHWRGVVKWRSRCDGVDSLEPWNLSLPGPPLRVGT
jgi:hypothetical protein